jgi:hypothetical protein
MDTIFASITGDVLGGAAGAIVTILTTLLIGVCTQKKTSNISVDSPHPLAPQGNGRAPFKKNLRVDGSVRPLIASRSA